MGEVVFGTSTWAGRAFDVVVLVSILLSICVVCMESVAELRAAWGGALRATELALTGLFTVEYALRVWSARERRRYVLSGYGLIDLAAILPTYMSLVTAAPQALLVLRALRLLRVFRILGLSSYLGEAAIIRTALLASARKITVFLWVVMTSVLILGTLMYLIEGEENGFTSIPQGVYWAVVTLTTVGYGDVTPQTTPGKLLAVLVMILGYAMLAVPTGIVSVELGMVNKTRALTCSGCGLAQHEKDARHCRLCGLHLFMDVDEAP